MGGTLGQKSTLPLIGPKRIILGLGEQQKTHKNGRQTPILLSCPGYARNLG